MYEWRTMTVNERAQLLRGRKNNSRPWHSPPHFKQDGIQLFHLTAACYEHKSIIGKSGQRLKEFEQKILDLFSCRRATVYAWCVLPNHWHALVQTESLKDLISSLGKMHGRTSFMWNKEDHAPGRKCWHRCADRRIRSDRHFYVARNYIHHNPVKHGHVDKWEDWLFSSANAYINEVGREGVLGQCKKYPVFDMGEGWDD